MAWSRVSNPAEMVKPGDEITVKVLRVDGEKQKISLGLKQLSADPWSRVAETYKVGQRLPGRVTRVAQFGAFVELEPGVEALAHASTFEPTGRSGGWTGQVTPGTTGTFEILTIDLEQKRIGVALVPEGSAGTEGAAGARPGIVAGARLTGKVERHENFGVFVFLAPGRTGVIPLSETGVPKEGDFRRAFPVGSGRRGDRAGNRSGRPAHPPEREGGRGSARGRRSARVDGAQCRSRRRLRDTRRQAALSVQVA